MSFDFDKPLDRRSTSSIKWNKYPENVLPMWVADMDFESPIEIKHALQGLADFGNYGYSIAQDSLYEVIMERLQRRHQWTIEKEWIVLLPGLVPGLHAAAKILDSDVEIMTSTPVYYHLSLAGKYAGLQTKEVPFVWQNNRWEMDFEQMKANLTEHTRMYMLCNPHNPNGRVFDKEELGLLADFCNENNLMLVSDEIHCDLVLDESKSHLSIAAINEEIAQKSITLLAPSKTFNIAGLGGSMAIIPNDELRAKFQKACFGIMPHMNAWACETMEAAYRFGEPWRRALIKYLKANHDFLWKAVNEIDGLEMAPLEATYLAWIKCEKENPEEYLLNQGLGVSGGYQFNGEGYFRLNFGTQRENLVKAVEILRNAQWK